MRFRFRHNIMITASVTATLLAVFFFLGYLGFADNAAKQADALNLPVDLIVGKQETKPYLAGNVLACAPFFTKRELQIVGRQNIIDSYSSGLRTMFEVNGILREGFAFASNSHMATLLGVKEGENVLFSNEFTGDRVDCSFRYWGESEELVAVPAEPLMKEYDYLAGPVLFVPSLSHVNQLFISTRNVALTRERLDSVMYKKPPGGPYANLRLRNIRKPYYYIDEDMVGTTVAHAKSARNGALNKIMITIIALALVVVYNLLLVSYFRRQREVGILKAIGFTGNDIYVLLQTEVIICSVVGVIVAVILSILATQVLHHWQGIRVMLSPVSYLWVSSVAVVLFYLGSVFPSALLRDTTTSKLLREAAFKRR